VHGVVVETAPQSKTRADESVAQNSFQCHTMWLEGASGTIVSRSGGTFIHPFDDQDCHHSHATMGLEILEDAPDTGYRYCQYWRWRLIAGVGRAIKALKPEYKVFGVEPETAALPRFHSRKVRHKHSQTGKLRS